MALNTVQDYQTALNEVFYTMRQAYGLDFPFYQLTRTGNMLEADAITLRTAAFAYYKTRDNAQTITPGHEDVPNPHQTNLQGRSGRDGYDDASEDTAANTGGKINDQTDSKGRSNHGGNTTEDAEFPYNTQNGR